MSRQDAALPVGNPPSLPEGLALGAVAVAAGVVGGTRLAAGFASIEVSTKRGSPAADKSAKKLQLLGTEAVSAKEGVPAQTDDVRDLEGGAAVRGVRWTLRVGVHGVTRASVRDGCVERRKGGRRECETWR
jgi:hypothetical protein